MADTIKTNLGPVTAYADAKAHGYTGTREEFGALLANAGLNLKAAETAKEGAEAAKQAAETAQQAAAENQEKAETQAANAKASADSAAEQADAAKESATGAASSASAAQESETNAGLSATAAANAEAAAKQAQNAAETAKTDAEAAQTAAGNSADAAANSAADAKKTLESIPADYSALSGKVDENANGIRELKEDLGGVGEIIGIETTHSGKFIEIEPSEPILEDTCWSTQGNSVSSKASGTMTAGKFPVIPGDKIKLYGLYNGTTVYPLGIFVDQNNVIISQVGNTDNEATIYGYEQHTLARKEALEAIVPDSAKYVLVNGRNKTSGTLIVCPSKVEKHVNGNEQTKVKEIQFSPLYKKKIGCAGDSICYGNGYVGGYAKIIGENNGMTVQNLGIGSTYLEMEVAGSTVITCVNGQRTTWTTLTKGTFDPSLVDFSLTDDYGRIRYAKREWTSKHQYVYTEITQSEWNGTDSLYIFRRSIPERVQYFDSDCDYIIMEGGINDVLGGLYLGEVTEGFASELDTHTVLGGTEQMCRNLLARFAGKKLGFILIHKVLQLPFTPPSNADGTQKLYFDKIKEVLNKYSIPVLDLYNESGLNTGIDSFLKYTLATTNPNGDGIHPNEEGYRKFYVQKIEAWLKSL